MQLPRLVRVESREARHGEGGVVGGAPYMDRQSAWLFVGVSQFVCNRGLVV